MIDSFCLSLNNKKGKISVKEKERDYEVEGKSRKNKPSTNRTYKKN